MDNNTLLDAICSRLRPEKVAAIRAAIEDALARQFGDQSDPAAVTRFLDDIRVAQAMSETLSELLDVLGLTEMPYGISYADTAPAEGFVPAAGPALSVELEQAGRIPWPHVFENFSCVLGKLWLARRKGQAAYFEAARYGCPGGSFYLGFHKPQLEGIARYVSTGTPGTPMDSPSIRKWRKARSRRGRETRVSRQGPLGRSLSTP